MGFAWSNMFVHPDDDPRTDGGFTGERDTLVGYLRDQRLTLELKCADLTAEQGWFRIHMAGFDLPRHYREDGNRDGDFEGAVADEAVVKEAFERWRSEVAFAEDYVDSVEDLGEAGEGGLALREVLTHMIEEYARHNGHADFLRERIDGRVGQ